jgi:ferredoxin-type protein NapH
MAFSAIMITTFFYGRIWCGYLCPVGGLAELGSRMMNDRWKIEFRSLPQVQIRYGYFGFFLVAMPALGISACTLCNFITIPRLVEALSGDYRGMVYLVSSVGLVNVGLLLILGFFASKGRAYCQFMCPIGAADGLVNRLGSKLKFTRRIRIEKERCTGCNICARDCMCGAITMVDKIAVIDQLSCMSCHECVDVCDWNALAWTTVPDSTQPKRVKKGVEIHPQPDWQVINFMPKKEDAAKAAVFKTHSWARMLNALILLSVLSVVIVGSFVL